jgi:uncharacterized cupredoxin-like copper-binding protein
MKQLSGGRQMLRKLTPIGFSLGLAGLSIATGLLIVACGGDSTPTPGNAVVRVTVDDKFQMKPSITSAPAGKVSFVAINTSKVAHEVVVLKTDKAASGLVVDSTTNKVDEATAGENIGEVEVDPGVTEAATFSLSPGHYVFICNLPLHYKQGMFASFEVK